MEPGLTDTQSILSLFLQHLIISDILFHVYFGLGINSHSFCLGNRVYYLAIFFPSLVIVFISTTVNYSFLIILTPKEMVFHKVNIFIEIENYGKVRCYLWCYLVLWSLTAKENQEAEAFCL